MLEMTFPIKPRAIPVVIVESYHKNRGIDRLFLTRIKPTILIVGKRKPKNHLNRFNGFLFSRKIKIFCLWKPNREESFNKKFKNSIC
jgi:hypothetical protein